MKIIIAGVNGIIGTFLHIKLNLSYSIKGIGNKEDSFAEDYDSIDLTKKLSVENFVNSISKYDVLIFLVGLAHKKGKGKEIDEFRRINKQTLINLLSILDQKKKLPEKIIFASTISVYGEKINNNIYNEESVKEPYSPYAITKLEAEEYLQKEYASRSWILRFAPVYSPDFELNINRRTKIINYFYRVGDGTKKLSLCNLENIGITIESIIQDNVPAGVYNIADHNYYSYNDLLNYVKAKWIVPAPLIFVKSIYFIGKMINNVFLIENMVKLISDNIFNSNKIKKYVKLSAILGDSNNDK